MCFRYFEFRDEKEKEDISKKTYEKGSLISLKGTQNSTNTFE